MAKLVAKLTVDLMFITLGVGGGRALIDGRNTLHKVIDDVF